MLRASAEEWDKLSTWRKDMSRLGWRLLQVSTAEGELIAVFGKTKQHLP